MTRNSLSGLNALGLRATCENTLLFEDADLPRSSVPVSAAAPGGTAAQGPRGGPGAARAHPAVHAAAGQVSRARPCPTAGFCLGSFICWNTSRVLAVSSAARDPAGPGDRFELAAPYGLAGAPPWPAMTAVPPLDTRAMGEGPGEPGSCSRATSIGRSGAALRGKRCAGPVGGLR
jgi:hypothetical protein